MSLLRLISFDGVDKNHQSPTWDVDYSTWDFPQMSPGRYGGNAWTIANTGGNQATFVVQTANLQQGIIGSDFNPGPLFGRAFLCFNDAGTPQIRISQNTSGALEVYRGGTLEPGGNPTAAAGTLLGSTASIFPANTWKNVAAKVKIDSSTGFVIVQVEGVTVLTITGANTQATANAYFNEMGITQVDGGSGSRSFDNFYCMDLSGSRYNDFIGMRKIDMHVATANGSILQWTGAALPNYSQINDYGISGPGSPTMPDDDTTYIHSGPSGTDLVDTYKLNNFSELGDDNVIQVTIWVRSDTAAGGRQIKAAYGMYGSVYQGTKTFNATSTSYGCLTDDSFIDINPATSLPWTIEALNNLEVGVVNVGNGVMDGANVRVTRIAVERMSSVTPSQHLFVPNHPISC